MPARVYHVHIMYGSDYLSKKTVNPRIGVLLICGAKCLSSHSARVYIQRTLSLIIRFTFIYIKKKPDIFISVSKCII